MLTAYPRREHDLVNRVKCRRLYCANNPSDLYFESAQLVFHLHQPAPECIILALGALSAPCNSLILAPWWNRVLLWLSIVLSI